MQHTPTGLFKTMVRGYKNCEYDVDVLRKFFIDELRPLPSEINEKLVLHPPGGGLINHDRKEKVI